MHRKRLWGVVLVLVVVFCGYLIKDLQASSTQAQKKQTPVVGILQYVSHPALDQITQGVKDGLKDNGYDVKKGQVKLKFQNGQADQSKLKTMSQQLINQKADLLVGVATPAAQSLANETTTTPIILAGISDAVGAKLIASNTKPGGNITGVSSKTPLQPQIELAKTLLPKAKRVGVLYSSNEDNATLEAKETVAALKKQGYEVEETAVNSINDLPTIVTNLAKKIDFLMIPLDNTIANAMPTVSDIAIKNQLPVFPAADTMVKDGGLATVALDQYQIGYEAGKMSAEVLSGKKKTATTPMYFFQKGKIYLNEKTAKALHLTIPSAIQKKAEIVSK